MSLPSDPMILLSVVNTRLRDFYPGLDELCAACGIDRAALEKKLAGVGFEYDAASNQFR